MNLLEDIYQDVRAKWFDLIKEKQDLLQDDLFLHFNIGMYIRNKFLWNNKKNIEILCKMYNEKSVDNISTLLIEYFLQKIIEELC